MSTPSHVPHPSREEGATAVEYGLMVALIALVIFAGVTAFGSAVLDLFNTIPPKVWPGGGSN